MGVKPHINYLEYADWTMPQLMRQPWYRRFLVSGLSTLSMACMGRCGRRRWQGRLPACAARNTHAQLACSSILTPLPPRPYAFACSAVLPLAAAVAQTGIIAGIGSALVVCACNVFTSRMLLRQARYCGAADYELLGERVGGPGWQVFVEVSNWILLFGTIMVRRTGSGGGSEHALVKGRCVAELGSLARGCSADARLARTAARTRRAASRSWARPPPRPCAWCGASRARGWWGRPRTPRTAATPTAARCSSCCTCW